MHSRIKLNKGFVLLETIFYVVLFGILSVVVINSLITMTQAFQATSISAQLSQGSNIMEKITREIRQSSGINAISASSLTLDTLDDGGQDKTVEFLLVGTNIQLIENGKSSGNLNATNVSILDLNFTQITTQEGIAVKIFLEISSNDDPTSRSEKFYNTAVLRGSY